MASLIGDDTAERAGRLTLNPIPHIDPFRIVNGVADWHRLCQTGPGRPAQVQYPLGNADGGSGSGLAMNLLLAIIAINVYVIGLKLGISGLFQTEVASFFFTYLALINMLC